MPTVRIATFNLENLDDVPNEKPPWAERIRVMRPQLERARPDILSLQEVNGQEQPGQPRCLNNRAPKPQYRRIAAQPPDEGAQDITGERPILKVRIDLGQNRVLHVLDVYLKCYSPAPFGTRR